MARPRDAGCAWPPHCRAVATARSWRASGNPKSRRMGRSCPSMKTTCGVDRGAADRSAAIHRCESRAGTNRCARVRSSNTHRPSRRQAKASRPYACAGMTVPAATRPSRASNPAAQRAAMRQARRRPRADGDVQPVGAVSIRKRLDGPTSLSREWVRSPENFPPSYAHACSVWTRHARLFHPETVCRDGTQSCGTKQGRLICVKPARPRSPSIDYGGRGRFAMASILSSGAIARTDRDSPGLE